MKRVLACLKREYLKRVLAVKRVLIRFDEYSLVLMGFNEYLSGSGVHNGRCRVYNRVKTYYSIHGHRTLKAPHPVRSAQLTRVPPS
jgi:hypothetical protein